MSLLKLKDINEIASIKDQIDRMLDSMFGSASFNTVEERYALIASGANAPQFDTYYRGEDFVIQSHMPEFDRGEIKVSISGNLIAIGSEVKREREFSGNNAYRYQRTSGSFCKVMELPPGLDVNRARSTFRNGILEIVIPKLKAEISGAVDVKPIGHGGEKQERSTSDIKPVQVNTFPILREG